VGRYALGAELGAGGMAVVHLGRLRGPVGFARTVAIKRLYPTYGRDASFVAMFVDEARLAARVRHPNVVATLDVVVEGGELFLVMEHVHGVTLAELHALARARGERLPPPLAAAIVAGALDGLHAAHEATDEHGEPLGLVRRDVSPQNVMVGADGVARVLDFGFARAAGRLHVSVEGVLKGKVAYMAPEQIGSDVTSVRSDVYAAGVVLWEALAGRRLFQSDTVGGIVGQMLLGDVEPPSQVAAGVPEALDAVVLRALSPVPEARFATAKEMVLAIEQATTIATPREVAGWVRRVAGDELDPRAALVARVERETATTLPLPGEIERSEARDEPSAILENTDPLALRRRTLARLALAGVGLALAGAAAATLARRGPEPIAPASVIEARPEAPPREAPKRIATEAATPPAAPAATSAHPAVAAASPETRPAARPSATVAPRPSAPPARRRDACDPPYFVDAEGIRVPKPECL
jgi:serine/threonine-protein kinase